MYDSSKIKWQFSIRYFVYEFTLDIDVNVEVSFLDHNRFGPNTIARLPGVILFDSEWSTT